MNDTTTHTVANLLTAIPVPAVTVVTNMTAYIVQNGNSFLTMEDAFEAGCVMADYQCLLKFPAAYDADCLKDIYKSLREVMFVDPQEEPIKSGSTIGMQDLTNNRMLYVVVIYPGFNVIYFQKSEMKAPDMHIEMIASDLMRRCNRIEHGWKSGNIYDSVCISGLFGFEFDKKYNELLIPMERVDHAFKTGRLLALEIEQEVALLR